MLLHEKSDREICTYPRCQRRLGKCLEISVKSAGLRVFWVFFPSTGSLEKTDFYIVSLKDWLNCIQKIYNRDRVLLLDSEKMFLVCCNASFNIHGFIVKCIIVK